jgi:methyl-galactoside transport system substrate-binding protein
MLDVQSGNWATAPAKDIMDAWIGRYGDRIEMVMSNNDGMMLGAVESLKGNGWFGSDPKKQALIIGHDAIPETQPLIKDGTFYGAILQNPVDEGRAAIQMAINLINGKPVTDQLGLALGKMKDYRAPFIKITKANVDVAEDIYKKALGK